MFQASSVVSEWGKRAVVACFYPTFYPTGTGLKSVQARNAECSLTLREAPYSGITERSQRTRITQFSVPVNVLKNCSNMAVASSWP